MVGSLLLSGGISYGVLSLEAKKIMERVDVRETVEANFDEVWKAALATAEEMGITVVHNKLDEKEGVGIITGKTEKHRKIQIIVGLATPRIVTVGVNAKLKELKPGPLYMPFVGEPEPDYSFAADIINRIRQKCQLVSLAKIHRLKKIWIFWSLEGIVFSKISEKTRILLSPYENTTNWPFLSAPLP
jgi:hypothetical protein